MLNDIRSDQKSNVLKKLKIKKINTNHYEVFLHLYIKLNLN